MQLRLEVLHAQDLLNAEYRFGDLSCSFLGASDLRPFVEVAFQSQKQLSSPVHARGGTAVFGWSACFDLVEGDRNCTFRVYDKKGAQSAMRGDPLIGEAVLPLVDQVSTAGLLATFTLRNGRISTGQLTVHYEILHRSALLTCPSSVLLGTAFGDVLCTGSTDELAPCQTLSAAFDALAGRSGTTHDGQWAMEIPLKGAFNAIVEHSLTRSESSDSCDSFRSALEDPEFDTQLVQGDTSAPGATTGQLAHESLPPLCLQHHQRCEQIVEKYVKARMENDLATLGRLIAHDAIVTLPKPMGGTARHCGWPNIEAHLKKNPSRPDRFRGWTHVHTTVAGPCEGSSETTVVSWSGKVYKLGCWLQLRVDVVVDSRLLIRQIDAARA